MNAILILLPVFFVMFLGWISHRFQWITPDNCAGVKRIVFDVLFPFLIYKLLVEGDLKPHFLALIVFLVMVWTVVYAVGATFFKHSKSKFAHIMPFLLLTCEGGSVALPLFLTLGKPAYVVDMITFDIAGILINFGLLPAIVAKKVSGEVRLKPLLRKIVASPFMVAVILGIASNTLGLHEWLLTTPLATPINSFLSMVAAPISTLILFTLGYEFRLNSRMFKDIISLAGVRLLVCGGIVGLFFLFFPQQMQEEYFMFAVLIYFACPTGFPVPFQIERLCKSKDDEHFMSAFISLFILIALIGYSLINVYIASKGGSL